MLAATAMQILLWLGILTIGCLYVLGSAYGLYLAGRWLASRTGKSLGPVAGVVLIALLWLPVSLLALLVDEGPIVQLGIAISVYAVFAQPTCIGYWAGKKLDRMESERRWHKNADDWLAEWEYHEYVE